MDGLSDQANQESFSPYHFGFDNPVRYADRDGKCPTCFLGAIIGGVVDAAAQVGAGMLKGESFGEALKGIDYKEVGVAALAGFVSSGLSVIYSGAGAAGGAAVAGAEMALSKPAAGAIAGAAVSVMNQANDAQNKGEPLTISPVKIVTDIATDRLADGLADKVPEIHLNNTQTSAKVNETIKTVTGNVISNSLDKGVELSKSSKPVVSGGTTVTVMPKIPQPDATASPHPLIIQPVFKNQ